MRLLPIIRYRPVERLFESLDHYTHWVTLAIVAASLSAGLVAPYLGKLDHEAGLGDALHWAHYVGLSLIMLYILFRFMFVRNIGAEIASELDHARAVTPVSRGTYEDRAFRISPNDVRFVCAKDVDLWKLIYRLNYDGFKGDKDFELSKEDVEKRNKAILTKNANTFMLVRNPDRASSAQPDDDETFIGYTAVIPLSDAGKELYFDGAIKDRHFHPVMVAAVIDRNVQVFLWFAVVLRDKYRGELRRKVPDMQYWRDYLIECSEYHLRELVNIHCPNKTGYVWVQSSRKSLIRHLLVVGYVEFDPSVLTADHLPLLRRHLDPAIPLPRKAEGPWLTGVYAFLWSFIATFFLIWLLQAIFAR